MAQRAMLERKNHHRVLSTAQRVEPRRDLRYRRKVSGGRPRMSGANLVQAAQFHRTRSGGNWEERDENLRVELVARSWGFAELQGVATKMEPSWLELELPGLGKAGQRQFVSAMLAAHRRGGISVIASLPELATIFGCVERTIQRWTKDLEAAGLLEVIQTWQGAPAKCDRKRGFYKLMYRPGPALAKLAGLALLEGARELPARVARLATFHGRRARRRLKSERGDGRDRRWRRRQADRMAAQVKAHLEAERRRAAVRHGDQLELGQPVQQKLELPEEVKSELERRSRASRPSTLSLDNLSCPPPVNRGRVINQPVPGVGAPPEREEVRPHAAATVTAVARLSSTPPPELGPPPELSPEASKHCSSRATGEPHPGDRAPAGRKRKCPACGGGGVDSNWEACAPCGASGFVHGGRLE